MKITRMFFAFITLAIFLQLFESTALAAPTLTVTPASTSNTYSGIIQIQVTGLTNGETIKLQKFLDLNGNGVIDANEPMVEAYKLTDGVAEVIGGVTNTAAVFDVNPVAGAITAKLGFAPPRPLGNIVGRFIFRVSSPTTNFASLTASLVVTNAALAQSLNGTVYSNGVVPLPNAVVVALQDNYYAATIADSNGNYNLKVAPGNYIVLPTFPGMFTDQNIAAQVALGAGASATNNLYLTNGTATVSGRVFQAGTSNLLGGMFIQVQCKSNNLFEVAFTDSQGAYSSSVSPGYWSVKCDSSQTVSHSLVVAQGQIAADTTTGDVTNADIVVYKATGLIYGVITNTTGAPVPDISFSAQDESTNSMSYSNGTYQSAGYSDANGNYTVAVLGLVGTNWYCSPDSSQPGLASYIVSQNPPTNVAVGQAIREDFAIDLATNTISGHLKDNNNNPLSGVSIWGFATINGVNFQTPGVTTDGSGYYSMLVASGIWNVGVSCGPNGYQSLNQYGNYECPQNQVTNIAAANAVIDFTAYPCGMPQVVTTNLPNAQQYNQYFMQLQASGCNQPFNWNVSSGSLPSNFTLYSDGVLQGNTTNSGTFNFTVQVVDGASNTIYQGLSLTVNPAPPLQINTPSTLPQGTNGAFYSLMFNASGGAPSYWWMMGSGSPPLPPNLSLTSSNGLLSGNIVSNGTFNFSIQVMDQVGNSVTQAFSLTIPSTPLVVITTSLPPAIVTVPYTNQLQVVGGQPPYSWSLGAGSDLLPSGLNLSSGGIVSGVPTLGCTSNMIFRATDANANFIDQPISLTVGVMPSISQQPSGQNVLSGTNVSFNAAATGSPTLNFQWRVNGIALTNSAHFSGVTTPTLTINNVTLQDNGAYSVFVANAYGNAASSNANLTVTSSDTTKPTLSIATPISGQVITNTMFTATGTASDDVAVAAVYYQLNGGVWSLAAGTNNWNAALTLGAGTNVLNAYAADTSGNLSITSTVRFIRFKDVTRPTSTVTAPKSGIHVSNAVFNATGTAKDNVGVAAVLYQLNGGAWTGATGTTNWSTSLSLVPGTNVFAVCALDLLGNYSLTNTVKFIYAVWGPITVQIVGGNGTVAPNLNAKVLSFGIGYSMTAIPGPGYGFQYWSGGVPMSAKPTIRFLMQSNLVIIANFKDNARPVNVVSYPLVGAILTNSSLTATGRAKDNVGVSNVWFRMNGGSWNPAVSANAYTNWTAPGNGLVSGANLFQAFAVDAAGNASLTNSVKFSYKVSAVADWAPDTLNGIVVQVQSSSGNPETAGFDLSTYSQTGETGDTNAGNFGVGTYAYAKTSTNTAQLTLATTLPPMMTNGSGVIDLVFTNHYQGFYTNSGGSDSGTISAVVQPGLVPVSLAGRKIVAVQSSNHKTITLTLAANGTFIKTPSNNSNTGSSSGTYTFTRFSPVAAMLVATFTDAADAGQVAYVQLTFKTASSGTYIVTSTDSMGMNVNTDTGTFSLQ